MRITTGQIPQPAKAFRVRGGLLIVDPIDHDIIATDHLARELWRASRRVKRCYGDHIDKETNLNWRWELVNTREHPELDRHRKDLTEIE